MAFAPLDAWARMLFFPFAWCPPRYWLRVGFALFTSALGTAFTLPERLVLAPILAIRRRASGGRLRHAPGVVVILGYYRTGTTHLHYLLSCDPRFRTPLWAETLAPQGYALSWLFLRWFLIPFVSAQRPQDDVAMGPLWPAEDDFALNNWSVASSLPGRFVVPRRADHYARFHSLRALTPRELNRWRRAQWAFCWKVATLAPSRVLLLKTPSHTARVRELADLFPGVKFIHISRDPAAVVRSNVSMHSRLEMYNLQPPPPEADARERIVAEYAATERAFDADAAGLPAGTLAEMRYEDLVADPIAELRRAYAEIGLDWSPQAESCIRRYLQSVSDYRAAAPPRQPAAPDPRLAFIATRFGHDRPPRPHAPPEPAAAVGPSVPSPARGRLAAALAAVACVLAWIVLAMMVRNRYDWMIWPVGTLIGYAAHRAARAGSVSLGIWAAVLTLATLLVVAIPATFFTHYYHKGPVYWDDWPDWRDHIFRSVRRGLVAENTLWWLFLGMATAYRFASRKHLSPPRRS